MDELLNKMRESSGQMSAVLHAILRSLGKKPDAGMSHADPKDRARYAEDLSFWVGSFLSSIQQVDSTQLIVGTTMRGRDWRL